MSTDLEKTFSLPVITLVLLSFCLGTSEFIVIGILPDISSGLNVSITMAGSLVSIFAIVYAVGTPFAAALAGLFNKFSLIITLTIIFLIGNILSGGTPFFTPISNSPYLLIKSPQ